MIETQEAEILRLQNLLPNGLQSVPSTNETSRLKVPRLDEDHRVPFQLITYVGQRKEMHAPLREIHLPIFAKSSTQLQYLQPPKRVFVFVRPGSEESFKAFQTLSALLIASQVCVLVERKYQGMADRVEEIAKDQIEGIDLIITLGGDGTVIYASTTFPHACPPNFPF